MGHIPFVRLSTLSLPHKIQCTNHIICDVCHFAKQKKLSFRITVTCTTAPFDLLHVDIWGPVRIISRAKLRFFLTIVDDFTRFTWVFMMSHKSETRQHIVKFCKMVQTQFNCVIRSIHSDNGQEFIFTDFYQSAGIIHQRSCTYTPHQSSVFERKQQYILQVARSLLFYSSLPLKYWCNGVLVATHIINRIPSTAIQGQIPYELLYHKFVDYSYMHMFGVLC